MLSRILQGIIGLLLLGVACAASATSKSLPELPPALDALIQSQLQSLPKYELDLAEVKELFATEENDTSIRLVTIDTDKIAIYGVQGTTRSSNYILSIYKLLKRLNDRGLLPKTTMLFYFGDGVTQELYKKGLYQLSLDMPVFVFAVDKSLPDSDRYILFPDGYTMNESHEKEVPYWHGWKRIYKEIADASQQYSWQQKSDIAFWRGRLTDCFFTQSCEQSARLSLVQDYQDDKRVDASFVTASIFDISKREQKYKHLYSQAFVDRQDQLLYKYLLNIDGATSTYPGYLWRLYSNSLVLKQESSHVQWFYPLFKPYEHYVPINHDLSDLSQKLDWLEVNDDKVQKIALNATNQVEQYLSPDLIDAYIVALINRYAALIKIVD